MRLSNLISLYRMRLRAMLGQELLAATGIAAGVALVFAALVAGNSLTIRDMTDAIVGDADLQLAARGPDGFDERLLARVRRIDGVDAAAPIVEARANVVGPRGRRSVQLFGGDDRFARFSDKLLPEVSTTTLGRQRTLALPTPLAADLGLSLGQPMRIEVHGRVARVPLGAQLQERDVGPLVDSPVALASLRFAQALSGMDGRVSRIFVRSEPGRRHEVGAALRAAVGGGVAVRPAAADTALFERAASPTRQSTTIFSLLGAVVGFLFALSAVLLTVPQRQRFATDLRMAGHEWWAVMQTLLFDAFVLGAVASGAGLLLGDQLSRHLFEATPGYLSAAFAVGAERIVTWQSVGLAVGAGVAAACLAVLAPMGDVIRRHQLERRPPGEGGRRPLTAAGLACLAAVTIVVALVPDAAAVGLVALTLALLLLMPSALRLVVEVFERATREIASPVPTLTVHELRSRSTRARAFAVAATGAVAVFATVSIGGAHADLERGLDTAARTLDSNADIWLSFEGDANTLATTPFPAPATAQRRIASLPAVSSVRRYRGSFLDVGDNRAWVTAHPRSAPVLVGEHHIERGPSELAERRIQAGGWIVLSESIAEALDAEPGQAVTLPSPRPTAFRVAGISNNLGWPPGAIVMNADDYARAWDTDAVSALHVVLRQGAHARRVERDIERLLGQATPLRVETRQERLGRHYEAADDGLSRMTQISILVLIAAVLATATAMAGMIWQRRRRFAALKVSGLTQTELWTWLMVESGLLLGTGAIFGAGFGLYGQVLLSRALEAITGFPVFYSIAAVPAATILALVTAVALAMLAIPGWMAVRVPPEPGIPR